MLTDFMCRLIDPLKTNMSGIDTSIKVLFKAYTCGVKPFISSQQSPIQYVYTYIHV